MSYANYEDVQSRLYRLLSEDEKGICNVLLEDVAVLIDSYNKDASEEAKKIVSCRAVIRAIGSSGDVSMPVGASQGTVSALGYSQTWTIASGGAVGQLYLDKTDKKYLGCGARIGSHSPLEDM